MGLSVNMWELFVYFCQHNDLSIMITFIGDQTCMMDTKGRVLFPASFRKQMPDGVSDSFVLKKDIYESCLVLYPMEEWERQNSILQKKLNPYNKEHNKFLRLFYKDVEFVSLDNAGRFLISSRLQVLARIEKEIVLAGQLGKIEVWSKAQYEMSTRMDGFSVLAEKLLGTSPLGMEDV